MKAVIETGGKQYYVEEGSIVYVEKLDNNEGDKVVFDNVLLVDGNPVVKGAKVEGKVIKQGKNRKIRIFKYVQKNNKNRKTQGHRQPYTKVEIVKITK